MTTARPFLMFQGGIAQAALDLYTFPDSRMVRVERYARGEPPLNDYGFSRRFGWLSDRFGVSWQLNLAA